MMERADWKNAYTEFLKGDQKKSKEIVSKLINTREEIKKDLALMDELKLKISTELEEIDQAISTITKK